MTMPGESTYRDQEASREYRPYVDPELGETHGEEGDGEEAVVMEGQRLLGDGRGEVYDRLQVEDRQALVLELCRLADAYRASMQGAHQRWAEIAKNYTLGTIARHAGQSPGSSRLTSELLMMSVDQVQARILDAVAGVDPLPRAEPVVKYGQDKEETKRALDRAGSVERFLHSFAMRSCGLEEKLDTVVHRLTKLGTSVLYQEWDERTEHSGHLANDGSEVREEKQVGGIRFEMVPNEEVILWPPTCEDWQECELVGHRIPMTESVWSRIARRLGLSDQEIEESRLRGPEVGSSQRDATLRENFGVGDDEELKDALGYYEMTQLWLDWTLPGDLHPTCLVAWVNEDKQQLLFLDENPYWMKRKPYFPIRYKKIDGFAWGLGVGHEVLFCQSVDTTLRNLEIDNLLGGAYRLILARAGTAADHLLDRPAPNQKVSVDNMDDVKTLEMGGSANGLTDSRRNNRNDAREATGYPPVLSGHGDPTLKSGGGTGSTIALIEQAQTKFGHRDRTIRSDLGKVLSFSLELATQYGDDEMPYHYVSETDGAVLQVMKFEPIRGPLGETFKVSVRAPSAATSREGRKASVQTLHAFMVQYFQLEQQLASQVSANDPEAVRVYQEDLLRFLHLLTKEVIEAHGIPGLSDLMAGLPESTDQTQMISQLQQQLASIQGQLEQIQSTPGVQEAVMAAQQQQQQMQQFGGPQPMAAGMGG